MHVIDAERGGAPARATPLSPQLPAAEAPGRAADREATLIAQPARPEDGEDGR
jgi:hypothetical protein